MKGRKAVVWKILIPAMIGITAALFLLGTGGKPIEMVKGWLEGITLMGTEQGECMKQPGHFWCERALKKGDKYQGECKEWGTLGEKDANCDPKSYKPISYKQGEYDICRENCKVDYCPAGTGRTEKTKCASCKNLGEDCGGWFSSSSDRCCAQEFLNCEGTGIFGSTSGKCKKKANVK